MRKLLNGAWMVGAGLAFGSSVATAIIHRDPWGWILPCWIALATLQTWRANRLERQLAEVSDIRSFWS